MTSTKETTRYIIPDPKLTPRKDVLEAMSSAARAESEEELFPAIQAVISRTSCCRAPSAERLLEIDRRADRWETTRDLLQQWSNRCYRADAPVRTRCQLGCQH